MTTPLIPIADGRRVPRALVCASALVVGEGTPATEHMVYDLSTMGARLCGVPHARIGDEIRVGLQLPRAWVHARGCLLREGSTGDRPDFAIAFSHLSASAEDDIHDAVVEALAHPDRRSLLLVQSERNPNWSGWDWFHPLSALCATAMTALEAVEHLEKHRFDVGLFARPDRGPQETEWIEVYPEASWRAIDDAGRLRLLG